MNRTFDSSKGKQEYLNHSEGRVTFPIQSEKPCHNRTCDVLKNKTGLQEKVYKKPEDDKNTNHFNSNSHYCTKEKETVPGF